MYNKICHKHEQYRYARNNAVAITYAHAHMRNHMQFRQTDFCNVTTLMRNCIVFSIDDFELLCLVLISTQQEI